MNRTINAFTLVFSALLLSACASGYKEFYKPAAGATPEAITALRVAPPPAVPIVERGALGDAQSLIDSYAKRGYVLIGHSWFNSGRDESEDSAVKQGQSVGADLVYVINPKYTGSVTTSMPLTTPTTSTTVSSGTATAYGSGRSVTAYGNGTSTTYGSTTTYIPVTVHRSDYGAVYFVKQRFGLGAYFRDLTDSERQQLQSNRGAVVRLIVDNTPAFNSDILVGDVLTELDGLPITNAEGTGELLRQRRGKQVTLSLIRNSQRIQKRVQLNP